MIGGNRLQHLLWVHLLGSPIVNYCTCTEPPQDFPTYGNVFFGVFYCQGGLLGFWFAFSPSTWWRRILGLILGELYLFFTCSFLFNNSMLNSIYWMVLVLSIPWEVALSFCLIRHRSGMTLYQVADRLPASHRVEFKASTRSLMFGVLIAGVILRLALFLRDRKIRNFTMEDWLIWNIAFVILCVLTVRGVLRASRPITSALVGFSMATTFYLLAAYLRGNFEFYLDMINYQIAWLTCFASLVLSLLVVRSQGFRLAPTTE